MGLSTPRLLMYIDQQQKTPINHRNAWALCKHGVPVAPKEALATHGSEPDNIATHSLCNGAPCALGGE